jgi:hypothetical protein
MMLRSNRTKLVLVIEDEGVAGEWTVTMTRLLNEYSSQTTISDVSDKFDASSVESMTALFAEMLRLEAKRAAA